MSVPQQGLGAEYNVDPFFTGVGTEFGAAGVGNGTDFVGTGEGNGLWEAARSRAAKAQTNS